MSSTVLNVATVDLIIEQALSQCSEYDKQDLQLHLANDKSSFLFESRGMTYTISNLSFSREGDATYSDIINTISLLENVTFLNCEFNGNKFYFLDPNQRNSGIHFQNCKFKNEFELKHHVVHENYKGGVFFACTFDKPVVVKGGLYCGDIGNDADCAIFHNCIFADDITLYNVNTKSPVFCNNLECGYCSILHKISILYCNFEGRFFFEGCKTAKFEILKSEFHKKVNLRNNSFLLLDVDDSNFYEVVDFHESKFGLFRINKCIFTGFVGFERCEFQRESVFKYVTFNSFTNFRSAFFQSCLSFEHTNMMNLPNFFNCSFTKQAKKETDRETFRIIKNSFDAIGNYVEGNRFYANEMYAYERELKSKKGSRAERALLRLNKLFSGFGQKYWLPIVWLIALSGIFASLIYGHNKNLIYSLLPGEGTWFHNMSAFFNGWASSLIVFKPIMVEGMELLSLVFGVFFSILIWLTITSIKRHTRR